MPASRPLRPDAGVALASSHPRRVALEPSLDDRILAVEARLIERERALGAQWKQAIERVRIATRPRRLIGPLIGVGVAALAIWWLLRGRGARAASTIAHAAHAAMPLRGLPELPWMPLLAFLWPLLPQRWRTRVNPGSAATLIGVGVPLLQRLLGARAHAPLQTADAVDLARYAGTWYEIARLPQRDDGACAGQPVVHHRFVDGALQTQRRCIARDGSEHVERGIARPLAGSGDAKLRSTAWPSWLHWLPLAWTDEWILYVDGSYDTALLGHPNRESLRVLSRQPRMPLPQLETVLRIAAERGFAIDRIALTQPD